MHLWQWVIFSYNVAKIFFLLNAIWIFPFSHIAYIFLFFSFINFSFSHDELWRILHRKKTTERKHQAAVKVKRMYILPTYSKRKKKHWRCHISYTHSSNKKKLFSYKRWRPKRQWMREKKEIWKCMCRTMWLCESYRQTRHLNPTSILDILHFVKVCMFFSLISFPAALVLCAFIEIFLFLMTWMCAFDDNTQVLCRHLKLYFYLEMTFIISTMLSLLVIFFTLTIFSICWKKWFLSIFFKKNSFHVCWKHLSYFNVHYS